MKLTHQLPQLHWFVLRALELDLLGRWIVSSPSNSKFGAAANSFRPCLILIFTDRASYASSEPIYTIQTGWIDSSAAAPATWTATGSGSA